MTQHRPRLTSADIGTIKLALRSRMNVDRDIVTNATRIELVDGAMDDHSRCAQVYIKLSQSTIGATLAAQSIADYNARMHQAAAQAIGRLNPDS
jgi:hypothetical protein